MLAYEIAGSCSRVQNEKNAFHNICKTENAFVVFKVFHVLAYNCEREILCTTVIYLGFKNQEKRMISLFFLMIPKIKCYIFWEE